MIRAWRSHGRRRVRQRSSRVDVLFLFAVAFLYRVRHRSSRIVVASFGLLVDPPEDRKLLLKLRFWKVYACLLRLESYSLQRF
jgi:hypothetical protein